MGVERWFGSPEKSLRSHSCRETFEAVAFVFEVVCQDGVETVGDCSSDSQAEWRELRKHLIAYSQKSLAELSDEEGLGVADDVCTAVESPSEGGAAQSLP